MRISKKNKHTVDYSILVLDDDQSITLALKSYFEASGYRVDTSCDPIEAIDKIKNDHFDILVLDYLMSPMTGDEVVSQLRIFDKDLYIILLTGHKDLAPPVKTIRELDIQGYFEKSDRFDQLELLVESCVKSIDQMRTIKKYRDGLNAILDSVPMIYQLQPLDDIINTILTQLLPLIECKDAFVLIENTQLSDINMTDKSIFKGIGCFNLKIEDFVRVLFPDLFDAIGQVRLEKRSVNTDEYLIVPMVNENSESLGVLGIKKEKAPINDTQIQLFEVFAKQAASAISNAFLHSLVNIKNQELTQTYQKLRESYIQTVGALRLMVDAKDIYTRGHSDRVSYLSKKIAIKMGKDDDYIQRVGLSGLFHDVGKIGVADDILLKEKHLSNKEYEEVKKHAQRGANILSAISFFDDISVIVKHHHERYDGSGYPNGLAKTQIPEEARIIAVADAFDAMTSERVYRNRLSLDDARNELVKGKNKQFDPSIVDVFLSLLDDYEQINADIKWTYEEIDPSHIHMDY